ncbi:hypothetical protein [Quadrisphaera setariae]|uniref:hypothetical protein n=1 Tax=Quadrisphaera setariae TaxID=2593304 RepID=UPI00164FA9AC|nr:hypothetical protein [Quadrisphaera setariae]
MSRKVPTAGWPGRSVHSVSTLFDTCISGMTKTKGSTEPFFEPWLTTSCAP